MALQAVDIAVIVGPTSGHLYAGYDTGERWNGSPVIAFTHAQLQALIEHGDGMDSNGYGLTYDPDTGFTDVSSDTETEPIPPQTMTDLDGAPVTVYIPDGRCWDVDPGDGGPSLYNADLECTACGSHLANPHQPTCPTTEAKAQHTDPIQQWQAPSPISTSGPEVR